MDVRRLLKKSKTARQGDKLPSATPSSIAPSSIPPNQSTHIPATSKSPDSTIITKKPSKHSAESSDPPSAKKLKVAHEPQPTAKESLVGSTKLKEDKDEADRKLLAELDLFNKEIEQVASSNERTAKSNGATGSANGGPPSIELEEEEEDEGTKEDETVTEQQMLDDRVEKLKAKAKTLKKSTIVSFNPLQRRRKGKEEEGLEDDDDDSDDDGWRKRKTR
ncbi:hypothetical protein HDV05_005291 [Chytridiales sp. JEL 0842]|nr:hypothetical protein HDV05_005291 [Chytridiales sp. JEL 0842]